jgi:predicted glycosyltransferase
VRILYDIVHPADVHFFRNAIQVQRLRGDRIAVTSRDKDLTVELLDQLGLSHQLLTRRRNGPAGLLVELFVRDARLLKFARDFRPDILVANNSPCVAHVGWLLRRPSLIFDDTEIHRYNRWLYRFFVTEVHSPKCFGVDLGRRQRHYASFHALSYLHPAHFKPDPDVLTRHGMVPQRERVFVRFVDHRALHDLGNRDLSEVSKQRLVETLAAQAEVVISSETALPPVLEPYRLKLPPETVHHVLAFSELVVAESATMCAEAAVLGTPAIYVDRESRGYIDDLENRYGLCWHMDPDELTTVLEKALRLLASADTRAAFRARRKHLLSEALDASDYQLAQIDRIAKRDKNRAPVCIDADLRQ